MSRQFIKTNTIKCNLNFSQLYKMLLHENVAHVMVVDHFAANAI